MLLKFVDPLAGDFCWRWGWGWGGGGGKLGPILVPSITQYKILIGFQMVFQWFIILFILYKNDKKTSKTCLWKKKESLVADLFNLAGDGDEGVGAIWDHFQTILGNSMPQKHVFQPNWNFLEIAHTNFVYSIRIIP